MKSAALPEILPTPNIRFKNILFASDLGMASAQAQVYAALLSRFFGAHLYVLHVAASPGLENATQNGNDDHPQVSIGELNRFFQGSGVPFTMLLEQGGIGEVLNRVADQYRIDLIILGSHGRHGADYLFMGSVSENVTRSSTRPVITVGPKACPGFENSLQTILWATDFSEESKLALPFATLLAEEFQANLTVFHVAPKTGLPVRDQAGMEAYLLNKLKRLAPHSRFPRCTLTHAVAMGEPAEEIIKAARLAKADLVILGLHSSVRFTSHLPERLSYRVLSDATCPVLSVLPSTRELKFMQCPESLVATASCRD